MILPTSNGQQPSPWTCKICHKPIASGKGSIELRHRDEKGAIGGYPKEATHEADSPNPTVAEMTEWLQGRVDMSVAHFECDPYKGKSSYQITTDRAETLEQWVSWALHLCEKTWMGKRDLFLFLALWFTNRKINYSDLA